MTAQPKPKKRLRVYRDAHTQEVHDDGHSWAVSYADFLMVLLSFFIIFFSVDKNERKELIEQIASQTGGPGAQGSAPVPAKKESDGGPADKPAVVNRVQTESRLPSGISEVAKGLDGFFVEHEDKSQKLYIYFDENMYRPGEIEMPRNQIGKLNQILTRLGPFMKEVNVTFVGHTDSTVVARGKNKYVANNFDLSSLRATKALQEAVKLGFDPTKMFAKGVAEHAKGTRTISLVITPSQEDR